MTSPLKNLVSKGAISMLVSAMALAASAQDAPPAWDPNYEPPRMEDGTPSFAGIWSKASLTVLERSPQFSDLVIPPAVAQRIEQGRAAATEAANAPRDPNELEAPEAGQNVGGYNAFWTDPGTALGVIDGEYRSSWIIDPADGQIPYTEAGREEAFSARQEARENFDDPEIRMAGERCSVGFGSTGTPPMLNVLYNNHVQFFQDGDTIRILAEMNHNARIIRMNTEHRDPEMRTWLGDSIGHWEGDTLVVETTNFHPQNSVRSAIRHYLYLQPDSLVEERFTRVSDDVIHYEFTVTDPDLFTQPWTAEMPLWAAEGPIYEYACHEGNYSLPGILAGARRQEALAREAASENSGGE
ncbi:hypothetical protein [Ponticaulis sp.]|uniref:hypothetical protein n=1 Tax=Ponticaulis sp. TaxID=2020902 RepID=UPI000C5ECCCB|nr:hypothetical protein [Ponticaulis sp.]MAF57035.1 hypothetical protein [Ponticaulis sp.]MBN03015.1 hypothetical protein [Ponticaulis sp.]